MVDKANKLHQWANEPCFNANSVNFPAKQQSFMFFEANYNVFFYKKAPQLCRWYFSAFSGCNY